MPSPILGQPVDERTDVLALPLPSLSNFTEDDVPRVREAFELIDAGVHLLSLELDTKADGAATAQALAQRATTAQLQALALVAGSKLPADFSTLAPAGALDGLELVALAKAGATARATVAGLMAWLRAQDGTWTLAQKFPAGLQTPSLNGGQLAGLRNKIINGRFDLVQRGTSFATPAGGAYGLDRFCHVNTTGAAYTVSQEADAPPGGEFRASMRYTVTAADASITGAKQCLVRYWVEGFDARDLIARPFALSFWVRSAVVGTHCISLKNTANDRSLVLPFTVAAANTWTRVALSVPQGLITAGGWNWTNGQGLGLDFILAAAPQFQGAAGEWLAGGVLSTAQQVNVLGTVGNVFAVTGIQLEAGNRETAFEHRPVALEAALAGRYFEVLNNANAYAYGMGMVPNSTQVWVPLSYAEKRAAPTISFPGAIDKFQFQIGSGTASCTSRPFASSTGTKAAFLILPSTSAGLSSDSKACLALLAADARIEISAEL